LNARIDVTRSQVQYQTDVQRLRAEQADVEKQKLNLSRSLVCHTAATSPSRKIFRTQL
jgi:hypothetical protein